MSSPQEPISESIQKLSAHSTVVEYAAHYEQAYPRLTAVAAGVLGRQEGAEDIVQEAAGIAVSKAKQFSSPHAFVAWMVGVVRRCALNERRKTYRRRTYAADPLDISEVADRATCETQSVDPSSGELLAGQIGFTDEVQDALQYLSDDARCCLLLRVVHELSYAEIAELLGLPQGTAMSHVHRSRQELRRRLGLTQMARDRDSNSKATTPDALS